MASPLFQALVFGRFDSLPEETSFLLARTGLIPVFTGSGFHLAAARKVAGLFTFPLRRLLPEGRTRDAILFATELAAMALLASLTGWSSPLVRVFLLVTLSSAARLFEILPSRPWLFLLAITASAVLGKGSPLSFLFSMAGIAGILFFPARRWWLRPLGPWLFTLPICLCAFSVLPLLAPLYVLTFGLFVGAAALPLAIAALVVPQLLPIAEALLAHVIPLLARADAITGGAFWVPTVPWLCALAGLGLCLWLRRPKLAVLMLLFRLLPLPAAAALDVGQGDSILVRPAGLLLEDAGPPGFRGYPAASARALEALGISSVGDVMLSHFDLDHRGGLDSLLARHAVSGALWFREADLGAKRHEKVLAVAERARVPIRFVTDSAAPAGVRCWLAPFRSGNDSCPLCLAQVPGGHSILLTGDMSEKAESWFVENVRPFPQAEVLKVAHHGSRTSSSPAFLRASGARVALISVGARNRYHHPNPETLSRLEAAGMHVRRTDLGGRLDLSAFP